MGQLGFPINLPAASTTASRVDAIFYTCLGLSLFIAFGVCFVLLAFAVKYRRGGAADRSNPPSANWKLEAAWILIPTLLGLGVFAWAGRTYVDMFHAPPGSIEITVVGKQWMWKIQHPEGRREINELHIPIGRPVKLNLISQDVIHNFSVPAFRIKQDVLPGRFTTLWFQATRPGRYHLFCSQYCGTNHSLMAGWVEVMPPDRFQQWLGAGRAETSMVAEGGRLFLAVGCAGCHTPGATVRAPLLNGLYGKPVPLRDRTVVTADDRYLVDSILGPASQVVAGYEPVMPDYTGRLNEEQAMQLVAFIKGLGGAGQAPAPPGPAGSPSAATPQGPTGSSSAATPQGPTGSPSAATPRERSSTR